MVLLASCENWAGGLAGGACRETCAGRLAARPVPGSGEALASPRGEIHGSRGGVRVRSRLVLLPPWKNGAGRGGARHASGLGGALGSDRRNHRSRSAAEAAGPRPLLAIASDVS